MAAHGSQRGRAGCGIAVPLATAPAAAPPACTTTVNWIGLPGDGYAGGQVVQLEFTNTGKVTCTLYGHPGVVQMNAGRPAGHLDRHPGNRHAEARGDRARGAERPQRREGSAPSRRPRRTLASSPPGQRTALPDPYQSRACPGISVMHVNPVRPGLGVPFNTIR